jgi:hypothetical protein
MNTRLSAVVIGLAISALCRSAPASEIFVMNNNGFVSYEYSGSGSDPTNMPYAYFRSFDVGCYMPQPITPIPATPVTPSTVTTPSSGTTGTGGSGDAPGTGTPPVVTPTATSTAVPLPNSAAAAAFGLAMLAIVRWVRLRYRPLPAA